MMLKNIEAKTLPRVGAVAFSPKVLDQLLLRRLAGKVSRCLALEVSRGSELSTQAEFPFTPVLTGYSGKDESSAETGHNGKCKQKYAVERREYRECGPDPWRDVRKMRELGELAERLEGLEEVLKGRKAG